MPAGSRSHGSLASRKETKTIMNGLHFDTFVRGLPLGSSRRRLLAWTLVGVASPATIAHFGLHDVEARKGNKKKKKVTLCRAGQTVTVSRKARKKLLREGATVGACQRSSPPPQICTTYCAGKSCGGDGCGGSCGQCQSSQVCSDGTCCSPNCDGRNCSDDGCGGTCGTCGEGEVCKSGRCQVVCDIDEVVCFNECILESCQSQCNEPCRVIGASCCGSLTCKRAQTGQLACRP